jgi:uncharacterized protein YbjT (DUF2867 family)
VKVVIFGATGMVGSGALLECLDDPRVISVLVVGRSSVGMTHPKLREILHQDFLDYSTIQQQFADRDACFFCLGVTSAGKSEDEYRRLTYDVTLAAAKAMVAVNPRMTFCYVSGQGTDSTGRGRVMWARVKGKTENDLLAMRFKAAYMFRPALIAPMRGVRSKTRGYQIVLDVVGPILPLLHRLLPKYVTTTETVGRALIEASVNGYSTSVLLPDDINRLAARSEQRRGSEGAR